MRAVKSKRYFYVEVPIYIKETYVVAAENEDDARDMYLIDGTPLYQSDGSGKVYVRPATKKEIKIASGESA